MTSVALGRRDGQTDGHLCGLCWGKRNATLQNPFVQQLLAKGGSKLGIDDKGKWKRARWERGKVKGLYVSSTSRPYSL